MSKTISNNRIVILGNDLATAVHRLNEDGSVTTARANRYAAKTETLRENASKKRRESKRSARNSRVCFGLFELAFILINHEDESKLASMHLSDIYAISISNLYLRKVPTTSAS